MQTEIVFMYLLFIYLFITIKIVIKVNPKEILGLYNVGNMNFSQYPAIHTNYSLSNCTISN